MLTSDEPYKRYKRLLRNSITIKADLSSPETTDYIIIVQDNGNIVMIFVIGEQV
jgi:hypothetical protein